MNKILLLNSDASPVSFLPLTTITWKDAVNKIFDDSVTVLHEYEDWEIHSPSLTLKVPSVIMLKEFIKYQRYVQYNRDNVFLRDEFTCQYCGFTDETTKELSLDHVLPKFHGGKTKFTNIVTACHNCNSEKAHYMKMRPKTMPHKPSYHELVNKRKNYGITIPCEDWIPYLNWNEGKIFLK